MRTSARNKSARAIAQARAARKAPSVAEQIVWSHFRAHRTGFHWRREVPIFEFRVDFYCSEARLAVELDGEQHEAEADAIRDARLREAGIEIYRIPNLELFNIGGHYEDHVLTVIKLCEERSGRSADEGRRPPQKP